MVLSLLLGACASGKSKHAPADILDQNARVKIGYWKQKIAANARSQKQYATQSQNGLVYKRQDQSKLYSGKSMLAKAISKRDILSGFVQLNFINTEIKQATRLLLDDVLARSYTVDDKITGTIHLKTQGPVSKTKALSLLEEVLNQNGAVIVPDGKIYRVMLRNDKMIDSISTGSTGDENQSGIKIVRLKHVSSTEIAEILEPFAGEGILGTDVERNAIMLSGTPEQYRSWMKTIRTFDVDWLAGRSVGVFKIDSMSVDDAISSLEQLVSSENSDQLPARFISIEANNTILAIARTPEILRSVRLWVSRLEESNGGKIRLQTYNMKYAQATDVAPILADLFSIPAVSHSNKIANSLVAEAGGENRATATSSSEGSEGSGGTLQNSGPKIVANKASNSLLLHTNKGDYDRILKALKTIDIPERQVLVEAVIVEVRLNQNLRHGVQYALQKTLGEFKPHTGRCGRIRRYDFRQCGLFSEYDGSQQQNRKTFGWRSSSCRNPD